MGDRIVIDRKLIEEMIENSKPYAVECGSIIQKKVIEALEQVLQQSQSVEEVVKPLLEDFYNEAYHNGTGAIIVSGNEQWEKETEKQNGIRNTAIQSILNKLKSWQKQQQ